MGAGDDFFFTGGGFSDWSGGSAGRFSSGGSSSGGGGSNQPEPNDWKYGCGCMVIVVIAIILYFCRNKISLYLYHREEVTTEQVDTKTMIMPMRNTNTVSGNKNNKEAGRWEDTEEKSSYWDDDKD